MKHPDWRFIPRSEAKHSSSSSSSNLPYLTYLSRSTLAIAERTSKPSLEDRGWRDCSEVLLVPLWLLN